MTATADARQGQSWQQQASWRHIWAISWPVLLANITFPLVGAADTAMMGRLEDASFVGGADERKGDVGEQHWPGDCPDMAPACLLLP